MKQLNTFSHCVLCYLLALCLPDRTKRMVVISSLTANVLKLEELDTPTMERLNKAFKLCSLNEAMQLPVLLNSLLWRNKPISGVIRVLMTEDNVCESKITVLTQSVKSVIPVWLRYSDAQLHDDVTYFLTHRKDMLHG